MLDIVCEPHLDQNPNRLNDFACEIAVVHVYVPWCTHIFRDVRMRARGCFVHFFVGVRIRGCSRSYFTLVVHVRARVYGAR